MPHVYRHDVEMERVKEEPIWDNGIGVSEAAARAGLYADHEVKAELVLGPVVFQSADAVFKIEDGKINTCNEVTLTAGCSTSGSISTHNYNLESWPETKYLNRSIEEQFGLKSCSVSLVRITEHEITMRKNRLPSAIEHLSNVNDKQYFFDTINNEQQISQTQASDEKKFACDICGKKFKQKCAIPSHLLIHSGEKPFSCDFCGRQFRQTCDLIAHTHIHTGVKPHPCNTCGRRFRQKSDLIIHNRIHTGAKPYVCKTCGGQFRHKSSLKPHMRVHRNEKPYCCDSCGKYFTRRSGLIRHTRIHLGLKRNSCDICGKNFVRNNYLKVHKQTHDMPSHLCGVCGKRFSVKSYLTRHHAKMHGREVVEPSTRESV